MTVLISNISKASDLPVKWDNLALEYFQTREFLKYSEKYNPCKQRYYTLYRDGIFEVGAIVYTLGLDLLTYLAIPSPIKMKMLGIPCSVSSSGIIGNSKLHNDLIEYVMSNEKGLLLVLNLNSIPQSTKAVGGRTLPSIMFNNTFSTWEEYVRSLRADYRRRYLRISRPFSEITMKQGNCFQFDDVMYSQYLEVLKHSKGMLETLSKSFFQYLPSNFTLTTFFDKSVVIGWYISAIYKDIFYFFMGGIDYSMNKRYNTYLNILFRLLKEGIEKKASLIDLGQTAEIPKTRLGGKVVEKYMLGFHSNLFVWKLLKVGKGMLEYSTIVPETNVIKKDL